MTDAATTAVDLRRLSDWMDGQALGTGPITDATMLAGGTQNILLRFRRAGRDFVLRRPPLKPRPGNDEVMMREARVLGALRGSGVPHPGLIAACGDTGVLGAAFYLMEPVEGFNAVAGMPGLHTGDPAIRHGMGLALVEGAAALARVDYRAVGLEDFGRPENYLGRQVARWKSQLAGYASFDGWPGPGSIPGVEEVAAWLEANRPPTFTPGIMHGDYQIANVMFRHDGPGLAAIVDWELATIGDPLVDLGWLIATWQGSGGPELPVLRVTPSDGFPSAEDMIEHYAKMSDRDLSHVEWYVILACYRLGIILEGTFARACAGKAPAKTGDFLHKTTIALFERALWRISRLEAAAND